MSLSAARIKLVKSLKQKKFRQTYHKFTVEGVKLTAELVSQSAYEVEAIYALPTWLNPGLPDKLITRVNERELSRMSQLASPNEVLSVLRLTQVDDVQESDPFHLLSKGWSLYLDGIQSPSNLGAILRVAEWFGFRAVIRGSGTADLYNHKSLQASMGSFLRVDCPELELSQIAESLPDLPLFGTATDGDSIYDFEPPDSGIIVIGSEGSGIRPETQGLLKKYLRIPHAETSRAESLNAAVAAGVVCSWVGR
ncbi:MAG: TrmH family RNA methyltransferase [Bacteroidota bacterium]